MRAVATAENPLNSLEDWDDYVASRYQEGKDKSEFRVYDAKANPGVAEFYRLNHANQTARLRPRQEEGISRPEHRQEDSLGSGRVPQYPRRRQRPRHRPQPGRAPAPDLGSDPPRRQAALDGAHRIHPRSRQGPLPLWRAAMGRRRRHLPRWLRLVRVRSSITNTSPPTPTPKSPSTRPNTASTNRISASTTFTSPGATTNMSTTSSRTTCPSRRSTCSATTPSIRPTNTEPTST